jgi:hypothetical protein
MRNYTENEKAAARMIIRFYNMQCGSAYRGGAEDNPTSNINIVLEKLDELNGDIAFLKNHIKNYKRDHESFSFHECISACRKEATPAPVPAPAQPTQVTDQQVQYSMGILEQAVIGLIAKTQSEKIESEIMGQVEDKVRQFISDEYGTIERKIITVVDGKKVPMAGIQHDKFETVLKFVSNDEPVFLTGPAGSGKNVLCKQVAEALGLKFYFTNAVTQEYKLTGFVDAMGNYQETQFYKAFTQGGLFMLDEIDASIPEVLVILNAAIANRYFDFPGKGYVEAHPDFRVIAAGNTVGQGADYEYVGRNQLDAASLDRFAVVKVGYSEAIENSVACGNTELAQFCREFRNAAHKAGQQVIVSYRAIGRLAKMLQILTVEEALETCLVKGLEKDDLNIICNGIVLDSKYKRALKNMISRM